MLSEPDVTDADHSSREQINGAMAEVMAIVVTNFRGSRTAIGDDDNSGGPRG